MSADNLIRIEETSDRYYSVNEMSFEGGILQHIGVFHNLRDAMVAAEDFQKDNEVEYGITFVPFQS